MKEVQTMKKHMNASVLFLGDNLTVNNLTQFEEGARDYMNGNVSFWKYLTCANYRLGWDTAM